MKLMVVRWVDATMEGGWHDREYAAVISGASVLSAGFLINEDEDWVKLCQSTSPNEDGNLLEVPKKWITSIEQIGEFDAGTEVQ